MWVYIHVYIHGICVYALCVHAYIHMYVYIYCYIIFFTSDNEIPSPTDRCTVTEQKSMKNLYVLSWSKNLYVSD